MKPSDSMMLEDGVLLPTYAHYPVAVERGEGTWVWGEDGRKYLDMYGGHAVALAGHCPPRVVAAIKAQAEKLLFYSNVVYCPVRARAAKALVDLVGVPGSRAFLVNSGAEANENAAKIARLQTGRPKIIATTGGFHGRTAGALTMTGIDSYRIPPSGLTQNVIHVPFGDLAAAERVIDGDTAGFILEPVQSMGGAVTPPEGYLPGLERLCRERGAMLILDEIQTGLGRLGHPTAARAFGVEAHMMTFAKGLGSGVPCAAVVAAPGVGDKLKIGELGTTFGGGPLASAAMHATLDTIREGKLWERAFPLEKRIREKCALPGVKEIRGKGLLIGLILEGSAWIARDKLLERGVIAGTSGDKHLLRLLPPLTLKEEEVDLFAKTLKEVLEVTREGVAGA